MFRFHIFIFSAAALAATLTSTSVCHSYLFSALIHAVTHFLPWLHDNGKYDTSETENEATVNPFKWKHRRAHTHTHKMARETTNRAPFVHFLTLFRFCPRPPYSLAGWFRHARSLARTQKRMVHNKKQVALLAPTTILAAQHYRYILS